MCAVLLFVLPACGATSSFVDITKGERAAAMSGSSKPALIMVSIGSDQVFSARARSERWPCAIIYRHAPGLEPMTSEITIHQVDAFRSELCGGDLGERVEIARAAVHYMTGTIFLP